MIEGAGIDTAFYRLHIFFLRGKGIVGLKKEIAGFDIFFFGKAFLRLFHQFIGAALRIGLGTQAEKCRQKYCNDSFHYR